LKEWVVVVVDDDDYAEAQNWNAFSERERNMVETEVWVSWQHESGDCGEGSGGSDGGGGSGGSAAAAEDG